MVPPGTCTLQLWQGLSQLDAEEEGTKDDERGSCSVEQIQPWGSWGLKDLNIWKEFYGVLVILVLCSTSLATKSSYVLGLWSDAFTNKGQQEAYPDKLCTYYMQMRVWHTVHVHSHFWEECWLHSNYTWMSLNHIFRTYSYHPLSSHAGMCHGEDLDCNMFVLWLYYDCISGDGHQSVNDFHSGWPQAMYHVLTLAQLLQPQDLEGILESNAVTALVAKVGLGKPLGIGVF